MRTIKVLVDYIQGVSTKGTLTDDWDNNFIIKILKKHYNVVRSDNPDYLFFSDRSKGEFLKYDCIKIFYAFENIKPNFNLCDYAISLFDMEYEDRHLRVPPFFIDHQAVPGYIGALNKHTFTLEDLKKKEGFCAMVTSNAIAAAPYRGKFFNLLSEKYKRVDSGGRDFNNIGYRVKDKQEFLSKYKFSLAFENAMYYVTEKIVDAFGAKTIPIYWGDPNIGRDFNTKAFINCHEYESFEQVIERIKEIDNNDELYLQMMREPAFIKPITFEEHQERLEKFLVNIIEKDKVMAKQRDIGHIFTRTEENILKLSFKKSRLKHIYYIIVLKLYTPLHRYSHTKFVIKIREFALRLFGVAYSKNSSNDLR